jgi:hypothetical protein
MVEAFHQLLALVKIKKCKLKFISAKGSYEDIRSWAAYLKIAQKLYLSLNQRGVL